MRRRLIELAGSIALLIVIALVIPLGLLVRQLAHDRAVTNAENLAQVIAISLASVDATDVDAIGRTLDGSADANLSVILSDGTVVGAALIPGEDLTAPLGGSSGRNVFASGEAVYVPTFRDGEVAVVRVFVEDEVLTQGVVGAWIGLAVLGVALIVMALFVADRLGLTLRRSIDELADAAASLSTGNLETRVLPRGPPEVHAVGAQFNRMAEQVVFLLDQEREIAADLSHRLRTPMAALRFAIEGVEDRVAQEELLNDLSELERAVDFVITETRRSDRNDPRAATSLVDVIIERATFWAALAEEEERRCSTQLATAVDLLVPVRRNDLAAAIDAIVGNIFAHTPEGTPYEIRCVVTDRGATVTIDDGGPGIPEQALERGVSSAGSSGLGLDIARRTAIAAAGSLHIETSHLGGARVTLGLRGKPTRARRTA